MEKAIRQVLNKVSEGNIEPMFNQMLELVKQYHKKQPLQFIHSYAKIFIQMNISL